MNGFAPAMHGLILVVLIGTTVEVRGSPWLFQEIKPLSESDYAKKSMVPVQPVKEIDPTKTYINVKEDIRDDILGVNGTTGSKYKEGVQKLLDFLEAGPILHGTSKDHTLHNSSNGTTNTTTQDDQHKEIQTDKSIDDRVTKILLKIDKPLDSNTQFAKANLTPLKTSPPIGSNPTLLRNGVLKTPLNSKASFMLQQSRPPAIPVRNQIPYGTPTNIAHVSSLQQQKVYPKSQIPYSVHNGISKSHIPYSPIPAKQTYNPYAAYQRSSIPYRYGWYNTNGYNAAPNAMATQRQQIMRYPYTQRPVTAANTNHLAYVPRSRIPIPKYRSSPYAPTYNFHPLYAKSYNPNHPSGFYRLPSSFRKSINFPRAPVMHLATRGNVHVPAYQRSQITHSMFYRPVQWNMPRRTMMIPHGAALPGNVKYRRMAITDRRRNYNGLQSSHSKFSQETPLPLPLASIMTAARIVVPARPNTLNGALKSNVETTLPENAEQKGARAV